MASRRVVIFFEIILSLIILIRVNETSDTNDDKANNDTNAREIIGDLHGPYSDPDLTRNVSELIRSKGYPVEEHWVTTSDGFVLLLVRIPAARFTSETQVALCQHGLLTTADVFVVNFPGQSLGFILADAGYDVWLSNARGNVYSRKHVTLKPSQKEFWMFSQDDIALKDLPANIDYILGLTGRRRLHCVGHSMGTTLFFQLLSAKPEYNGKVKSFMALSPIAYLTHTTSPVKYLIPAGVPIESVLNKLGDYSFSPDTSVIKILSDLTCKHQQNELCQNIYFLLGGVNVHRLNMYYNEGRFETYDWGKTENIRRYGQATPIQYRIENIEVPVALFYGRGDALADYPDVQLLIPQLRHVSLNYEVSDPEFSHVDYVIGLDANKIVYEALLKELEKHKDINNEATNKPRPLFRFTWSRSFGKLRFRSLIESLGICSPN